MKVGIISPTFTPDLNGVSLSVESLVNKLLGKGFDIVLAAPKNKVRDKLPYIVEMPIFPFTKLFSSVLQDISIPYRFENLVFEFFKRIEVDIVHSHDSGLLFNSANRIANKLGVPHVHTFHVMMEEYLKILHPFGYKLLARRMARNACNKADYIIAPTDKIKDYLISIGVKKPIQTLLNIPNLNHINKEPFNEDFAKKYGIRSSDFVFASFGRLVKQKRVDLSIKYLAPLLKSNPNIKFIIAGFGPELGNLIELSKKLKVEDKIIFTGKYDKTSLSNIGSVSKCFVITSRSETQCITILEAMRMGLPVIGVDDRAYEYLVKSAYNGFLVDDKHFANICKKFYENPKLYEILSNNAIKSANELTQRDFILEYLDIYQKTVNSYLAKKN